jgi:transposase-like protein
VGCGWTFKGRQFASEVILWAVRWYLMFPISYRDLELMLRDRGAAADHTTIFRWIQAYAAELEKRIRPHLRPSNGSWRMDEAYGPQGCERRLDVAHEAPLRSWLWQTRRSRPAAKCWFFIMSASASIACASS